MAKKGISTGTLLAIVVLVVVISYAAFNGLIPGFKLSTISSGALSNPGCAFIPGTSNVNNPPSGCGLSAQLLQITPQIWNPGIGGQTGKFEATTGIGCKIFQQVNGIWGSTEFDQASSSGVCVTTSAYNVGTPVYVQFCEDDTTGCVQGDYKNTQTVMYCPLPSVAGTGICGQTGPGAGYVPFSSVISASSAPTSYFYMPIVPLLGDDPNGMNSGTSESTTWAWSNSTQSTASNTNQCFVNTGVKACDLPTATSLGSFYATIQMQPVGTLPASPQSIGYASFTPIDPSLQSGVLARGALNYVTTIEIKATTNNDLCTIQGSSGISLVGPFARGGSSTDQMYYAIIPDSAITKTTDQSGNPLTNGFIQVTLNLNCNQVYNGSGDVNAICVSQWGYFSTKYFAASNYNNANPEAVKTGNAGTSPTVNSSDNLGLTCSSSAYTVLIKT